MRRFFVTLLVLILLGAGAFFGEQFNFFRPGPLDRQTVVLISPHEGSAAIGRQLQNHGVIDNALLFRAGVFLRHEEAGLKAGEYAFPAHASMADVMGILVEGKSIQHKLTAAEGLTSQMIYNLVAHDAALTGSPGAVPPEGSLLPETYLFTHGMTRAQMLKRMEGALTKFLAKAWPARNQSLPFNESQALTLASIVEKESAIPEERRHIAAVFLNRLRLGMKLQSDPTIIYGITKGYPLGRGIRESELQAATPYNTYAITGLPPTPICNPGKDSIMAVLNPEQSADLYFVANGKGGHVFAATVEDQNRNVARWRQIEKQNLSQPAPPR